jgi:hypothetical protein
MKVKLKSNVGWPADSATIVPAGTTLDVSDEKAADWIARGLAEKLPASAPPPAPEPESFKRKK